MRLFAILRTIARFRLHQFLPEAYSALYGALFFWQAKIKSSTAPGVALKQALESLGPVFIKLGQMLSIRRDLLPDEMTDELSKLQDAVAPDSWEDIKKVIGEDFGEEFFSLFQTIDDKPIASASIAQVHNAVDSSGKDCVIKVVRPGIEVRIKRDIKLARILAGMIDKVSSDARRMRLPEVVRDYDRIIYNELDLGREAASMSELKRNFERSGMLYVPEPDWGRTSERVLTMQRIEGIPVGQVDELKKRKVDLKKLGELGVKIFFTQVFRDNFFHADMHPGNIFVDSSDPANPSYIAVDFGIMGSLDEDDKVFVAEGLLAFFNNDYKSLAQSYIEAGWVDENVSESELAATFRTVLEPISNRPIEDISLGKVLLKLFRVSKRFGMRIQPQLVLLDKTLIYIEGVGKQLYPELDLWQTAKPFLQNWMDERLGFKNFINKSKEELPKVLKELPEMPINLNKALMNLADADRIRFENDKIVRTLNNNQQKTSFNIMAAAGIIAASVLFAFDKPVAGIIFGFTALIIYLSNRND